MKPPPLSRSWHEPHVGRKMTRAPIFAADSAAHNSAPPAMGFSTVLDQSVVGPEYSRSMYGTTAAVVRTTDTVPMHFTIDLSQVTTNGDPKHGYVVFNNNCQVCHGANATGSWLPDLKRSPMITTPADFNSVVLEGVKAHNGMVSFARFLSAKDVEDVRAFLISQGKGEQLPDAATVAKAAAAAPAKTVAAGSPPAGGGR